MKDLSFLVGLLLSCLSVNSQNFPFPEQKDYKWPEKKNEFPRVPDSLKGEDAVILEEELQVNYETMQRRLLVKLQNEAGADYYKNVTLPENFDLTGFPHLNKQGRFSNNSIPYVNDYEIMFFKARLFDSTGQEIPLVSKIVPNTMYWIDSHGERIYDTYRKFVFETLKPGQTLEIVYKAYYKHSHLTYYLNGKHPKLKLKLDLVPYFAYYNFNKSDSVILKGVKEYPDEDDVKNRRFLYTYSNLPAVNYPRYSVAGNNNRHIVFGEISYPWLRIIVDWKNHLVPVRDIYQNINFNLLTRGWMTFPYFFWVDTTAKLPNYLKSSLAMKKYANGFERDAVDTSGNKWMSKVVEDMSSHTFMTAENMRYGSNAQYALTSSEHLLKKQLIEEFLLDVYENLFMEKNLFYYTVCMSDKRLTRTNVRRFDHMYYQKLLFAIPEKKSLVYYLPRYSGVKYYANELPFYLEGGACVLFPTNIASLKQRENALKIAMSRTPISKYNDNTRTENAVFKVIVDSAVIHADIKESLSGQFSTVLRHYYNNDIIDSTIEKHYFKRCTDKPNSSDVTIKLSSSLKTFPFKHVYACKQNISCKDENSINLKDYFSFIYKKEMFNKKLNHDLYCDFEFTDVYNYLFEFNKDVAISNPEVYSRNINNEFFEVYSELTKQDEKKYLLSVRVKLKKEMVPQLRADKLEEFVLALDEINSFKLHYN